MTITSPQPFMVDPSDLDALIEALESIPDRSFDVNRLLLGAQIARRNNERFAEEGEILEFANELQGLTTAEVSAELGPEIPPPTDCSPPG